MSFTTYGLFGLAVLQLCIWVEKQPEIQKKRHPKTWTLFLLIFVFWPLFLLVVLFFLVQQLVRR